MSNQMTEGRSEYVHYTGSPQKISGTGIQTQKVGSLIKSNIRSITHIRTPLSREECLCLQNNCQCDTSFEGLGKFVSQIRWDQAVEPGNMNLESGIQAVFALSHQPGISMQDLGNYFTRYGEIMRDCITTTQSRRGTVTDLWHLLNQCVKIS